MSADAERQKILTEIAAAFAVPRPAWFVDGKHCCECAEHEATLQSHDLYTLDYATAAYADPITFITNPDGFKYYMPALARLAYRTGQEYYLDQLLPQLHADRVESFTERQRAAVEALLLHLSEALGPEIHEFEDRSKLDFALARVRREPGPRHFYDLVVGPG